MKRAFVLLTAIALGLGLMSAPASASVPDWDKVTMPTIAQQVQIEAANVPVQGDGWSFHPASTVQTVTTTELAAKKSTADCAALGFFFCTWKDINYNGLWWAWSMATINAQSNYSWTLSTSPAPGGINNTGSSWANLTTFGMRLFDDAFCDHLYGTSGWFRDLGASQVATAQGSDWNDRVSSLGRTARTDVPC